MLNLLNRNAKRQNHSNALSRTDVDVAAWAEHGYCVLPEFFSSERVDAIKNVSEETWAIRDPGVIADRQIYSFQDTRIRKFLDQLTDEECQHRFVLNDLHLKSPEVRSLCLDKELLIVLRALLGTEPLLCQSLNFKWGTQQGLHQDTLYLPPPDEKHLIAIWVALEDISPDSGPLRYIPGSHNIPVYRFSDGRLNVKTEEVGLWDAYMSREMAVRNLSEQLNTAKKGDVFIWHAFLVHGGSVVKDPSLTRRSLVAHYFSLQDLQLSGATCHAEFGGHWLARSPVI